MARARGACFGGPRLSGLGAAARAWLLPARGADRLRARGCVGGFFAADRAFRFGLDAGFTPRLVRNPQEQLRNMNHNF